MDECQDEASLRQEQYTGRKASEIFGELLQ
jgi:hypothetical protein